MYRIIIAEDEVTVREGICKRIEFEKLGYILVSACSNGKEAKDIIDREHIDVVITDICMPVMDGLELARYIHQEKPHIKTVLLTGFSDFEYAKQAIKVQVYEYILKPFTSKQLVGILEKLKNILDSEHEKELKQKKLEQELYVSSEIVKEHFLNKLITHVTDVPSLQENLDEFGISLPDTPCMYRAFIVSLDDTDKLASQLKMPIEMLMYGVCNICRDVCMDNGIVFRNEQLKTVVLLFTDDTYIIDKIQTAVSNVYEGSVSVYVGDAVPQFGQLAVSYGQAYRLIRYRKLFVSGETIYAKDYTQNKNMLQFYTYEYDKKILDEVRAANYLNVEKLVHDMICGMRERNFRYEQINLYNHELVRKILTVLEKEDYNKMKEFEITVIDETVEILDIEKNLCKFFKECIDHIQIAKGGLGRQMVEKAILYIENNYQDSTLSLTQMCEYLSVSTSYFSSSFKAQTGTTLVDYVKTIRMDKAKDLLKTTSLCSYEIAERVGYSDAHYFSITFKKYAGCSPKEYRGKS